MSGAVNGQTALVVGADPVVIGAHATHLAEEGADVIAVLLVAGTATTDSATTRNGGLADAAGRVESVGRRAITMVADLHDYDDLARAIQAGVTETGRLDIVCIDVAPLSTEADEAADLTVRRRRWQNTIDLTLTSAWNVVDIATPTMKLSGTGGTIVLAVAPNSAPEGSVERTAFAVAREGIAGLTRSLAADLGPHMIRVNSVHPVGVHALMNEDAVVRRHVAENERFASLIEQVMPTAAVTPSDVSNAIVYLSSDQARHVTGVDMPVDAGFVAG